MLNICACKWHVFGETERLKNLFHQIKHLDGHMQTIRLSYIAVQHTRRPSMFSWTPHTHTHMYVKVFGSTFLAKMWTFGCGAKEMLRWAVSRNFARTTTGKVQAWRRQSRSPTDSPQKGIDHPISQRSSVTIFGIGISCAKILHVASEGRRKSVSVWPSALPSSRLPPQNVNCDVSRKHTVTCLGNCVKFKSIIYWASRPMQILCLTSPMHPLYRSPVRITQQPRMYEKCDIAQTHQSRNQNSLWMMQCESRQGTVYEFLKLRLTIATNHVSSSIQWPNGPT